MQMNANPARAMRHTAPIAMPAIAPDESFELEKGVGELVA
jgi:hypothetical protein